MNLFKKIWLKNLKKGQEPIDRFVEDVGPLKGRLHWIKYNAKGKEIGRETRDNAISIDGRSSIIRLIAQTASAKVGAIDPTDYKISKMRFGNALPSDGLGGINTTTDLQLHYYDILEASSRGNSQVFRTSNAGGYDSFPVLGAGGSTTTTGFLPDANTNLVTKEYLSITAETYNSANYTFKPGTTTSIPLTGNIDYPEIISATSTNPSRPPSHKTVFITLLDVNGEMIQKVYFDRPYNKGLDGNKIERIDHGSAYNSVDDPSEVLSTSEVGGTRIIYDNNDKKWKIQIVVRNLTSNSETKFWGHKVAKYVVGYSVGVYNIKNSIVPVTGWNTGTGKNLNDRFGGASDYYPISQVIYNDSISSSPIDDYSVNFSTIMAADQGNGKNTGTDNITTLTNRYVYYTEAFLFNQRDDLFSIIRLNVPTTGASSPQGFVKDPNSSFLLTWQISVDPN
jgi:hypothetical protein